MQKPSTQLGFSLIEVMLVLVLLGIATAVISVAVQPHPGALLRHEAEALAQRLAAAQSEVRVDGRLVVWQADPQGYFFSRVRWLQHDHQEMPVMSTHGDLDNFEHHELLRPRSWSLQGVQVQAISPLLLHDEWFSSAWKIELHHEGHQVTISRDARGQFGVE